MCDQGSLIASGSVSARSQVQRTAVTTYATQVVPKFDSYILTPLTLTRGSAIAEEPRDALRQLKYYGRFFD